MLGQIKRMRTSLEWAYELFFYLFFVGTEGGLLKGVKKKNQTNALFICLVLDHPRGG